ncbi:MAG: VWA domain-containing protein [Spirochaetes bacterium]|nr:VWA domain-containing protein [Spirochaetota bacterium]
MSMAAPEARSRERASGAAVKGIRMIQFGNYTYLVYIVSVSAVVMALYAAYLLWKRHAVALMQRGVARDHLIRGSQTVGKIKSVLMAVSIALCALLLLRPQWGEQVREVHSEGSDVLIALDVSPSMLAQDVKPSRLQHAKDAVRWLVESLKGDRVGLVLFSGDAFLQCPLTNDYGAFMMFLDAASPDSIHLKGTDIGMALRQAYRVFKDKRLTSRMLVIITDGEDHEGTAEEAAKMFRKMDVAVYTVGIGTGSGEVIPATGDDETADNYYRDGSGKLIKTRKDASFLKRIAGLTRGAYIDISGSFSDLSFIIGIINDQRRNEYGSRIIKEPREHYQIFTLLLIMLLSLELMLPERKW